MYQISIRTCVLPWLLANQVDRSKLPSDLDFDQPLDLWISILLTQYEVIDIGLSGLFTRGATCYVSYIPVKTIEQLNNFLSVFPVNWQKMRVENAFNSSVDYSIENVTKLIHYSQRMSGND